MLVYALFSRARSPGRLARFVVTARSAPWSDAAGAKHAPRGPFSVLERRHGPAETSWGNLSNVRVFPTTNDSHRSRRSAKGPLQTYGGPFSTLRKNTPTEAFTSAKPDANCTIAA